MTVQVITLKQVRFALQDYMSNWRPHMRDDWFYQWKFNQNGTLGFKP